MLARLLLTAACLLCARAAFDPALACERAGFSVIERCGAHVGTGNLAAAAQYANEVIAAFPDCVDSYQCAGVVAYTLGDTKAAIVAFEKAVGLNPLAAGVHANLGLARHTGGYLDGSRRAYEDAVALDPSLLSALVALCTVYDELERQADALALRLGTLSQLEAADPSVRARYRDDEIELRHTLARAYVADGRLEEARQVLAAGIATDTRLTILHAMANIPHVPLSVAEIAESRARTNAAVDDVIAALRRGLVIPSGGAVDVYGDMGYYLTYHGLNDEPLRRKIGVMHGLAYPHLVVRSLHAGAVALTRGMHAGSHTHTAEEYRAAARGLMHDPPLLPRKLRVGFVSAHVYLHSVSKMIARLITTLPRSLLSIVLFPYAGPEDYVTQLIKAQVDKVITLSGARSTENVNRNVELIAGEELDVLIYPEIGMHSQTYYMAFRRLAPVQISTHGNSETSGLPDSIDYFVSFDDIEADGGVLHYSEQLVRLEGFHSQFSPPLHSAPPGHDLERTPTHREYVRSASHVSVLDDHLQGSVAGVGLTARTILLPALTAAGCGRDWGTPFPSPACATRPLYLCPQSLYKLHPEFDAVIADILVKDNCGRVMFLHGTSEGWDSVIMTRLVDEVAVGLGLLPSRHILFGNASALSHDARCAALQALDPFLDRLVIAPQRGHNSFLALLASADVVVDSYPFGGCTSSYEALTQGTPVVSFPSDALRGRFTMAMLKRFGLEQFIAPSLQQLSALAVELGTYVASLSLSDRKQLQAEIATAARGRGLGDDGPVHEWTRLLIRATASQWLWMADNL